MLKSILQILFIVFIFTSCSSPIIEPVKIEKQTKKIDFLKDVKPVLDKRCVTCHSCYNAPCQAKYSSYEGLDRGASKIKVYDALRLRAIKPTRLFEDAKSTPEWRTKGFFNLLQSNDSNETHNDSIMMHMLHQKEVNPEIVGIYDPEHEELLCPRNKEELNDYFDEKPNHAMPYGLPKLQTKDYKTLTAWIAQGSNGPSAKEDKAMKTPSEKAQVEIRKWESFLNNKDAKHQVTARYLYEHLYLGHLEFKTVPLEFFQLVRSRTSYPQDIDTIVTNRVFDDPMSDTFYYRLQKIHSTIVHKTHMVYKLSDEKLEKITELFIKPKWLEKPHVMNYELHSSTNPFISFAQIPSRSRYQFLLDDSHFIIDTFIRGPVCRGQIALNVIHDHFWVMFKDPDSDITILNPNFLVAQAENLRVPIKSIDYSLFKVFSDEYRQRYTQYYKEKEDYMNNTYPKGQGIEAIWKGNKASDAPILTIYRHFNSASVHKGVIGEEPRTMWVIDYPQLERIYYALVAGYDIYGNVTHQTNIRRYMDFLRFEGELNFIAFMPQNKKLEMMKSWYINDSDVEDKEFLEIENRGSKFKYQTNNPKSEFIREIVDNHILKTTNIKFDKVNYVPLGETLPKMPKEFKNREDFFNGVRSLTTEGIGFIRHISDNGANTAFIRVKQDDGTYKATYAVVNRWHDNVNSLLNDEATLDSSKDTIDFLPMSVGSYPNLYVDLDYKDVPDFFDLLKNYDNSEEYDEKIRKYFISRSDDGFWKIHDWFQKHLDEEDPSQAGLYDLNRYYKKPW